MARIIDDVSSDSAVWLMDAVLNFAPSITYVAAGMRFTTNRSESASFNTAGVKVSKGFNRVSKQNSTFKVSKVKYE